MGAIPINPAAIASAGVYTAPANAAPIRLCSQPSEGAKAISMQFAFNQYPGFQVNFPNSPNAPMSQLCSLYVDASNSNFDVTIFFPDSGYKARVNAQGSRLIPVISAAPLNSLPIFYVLLDSSGALTTDTVNVIALNTFVPEFEANELENVLSYGYGSMFTPQPAFTQSANFFAQLTNPLGSSNQIIPHVEWYITAIYVNFACQSTAGASATFTVLDGINTILVGNIVAAAGQPFADTLIDLSGLNFQSSTGSGCFIETTIISGTFSSLGVATSIFGGILKT